MVAIVTDSTCDLPKDIIENRRIYVVPQHVVWGKETYLDGVELDTTSFYERLALTEQIPHTARPTPLEMATMWQTAREQENSEAVLCITATSQASGTYPSAMEALALVDFPVTVIDSKLISMAMGFLILKAADLRDSGAPLAEIAEHIQARIPKIDVLFTVATLDFLHRGGRIGKARHMVGSALQIKPILHLDNGQVTAYGSVRTRGKALNRIVDIAAQQLANIPYKRVAVIHGNAEVEARQLAANVNEQIQPDEFYVSSVCAAIGVHAGPGVVGIAYDANQN